MTTPTAPHPSGYWTLLTSGLIALIVVIGTLLIQPRLSERRLNIDDQYILTATEVRSLPAGTLAVVLDRSPGEDHSDFKYRLLELVLQNRNSSHVHSKHRLYQQHREIDYVHRRLLAQGLLA